MCLEVRASLKLARHRHPALFFESFTPSIMQMKTIEQQTIVVLAFVEKKPLMVFYLPTKGVHPPRNRLRNAFWKVKIRAIIAHSSVFRVLPARPLVRLHIMPSETRLSAKLTLVSGRVFNNFHTKNQFIDHKGMKQIQISKTFDTFWQDILVFAK